MKDKNLNIFESTDFISFITLYVYNNLVDTCNISLILFLKCDVTKFRIPPPLVTQYHTLSTPSAPLNM